MESRYLVLTLYRQRQFDKCIDLCNTILNVGDNELIRSVRLRSLTIQAKVAGSHYDEVEYNTPDADALDNSALAKTPRSGTSLMTRGANTSFLARGTTASGLKSRARTSTARTARAVTAARAARTAGGALSRSQPSEYSDKLQFEYIFYYEGEIRKAMELAIQAQKSVNHFDWWWKYSLAKCYSALGMNRNAEEYLRQTLKQHKHISLFLQLINIYIKLNQPMSALEVCKAGLNNFFHDCTLKLEEAHVYEAMGESLSAVQQYRVVATHDATNVEAIASIAVYNFYNDQPEIALRYYRRLLAATPVCAEMYNNIGLCCLYSMQWDLTLTCFQHALFLATTPETKSEIWYNLFHLALLVGDLRLAEQCLQLSLSVWSSHESARHALHQLKRHMAAIEKTPNLFT